MLNPEDDIIRSIEDLREAIGPDIPIFTMPLIDPAIEQHILSFEEFKERCKVIPMHKDKDDEV